MQTPTEKIPNEEGYLVEFKDFTGGISVKELSSTICSFANTDGGEIYIGVTDAGQIKGVKITTTLLDHIQNSAREGCTPPTSIALKEIDCDLSKKILKISVEKSNHLHSTQSGHTYIRVGTQDKRVMGDELLRLAESKSFISFEEQILDADLEALDPYALEDYRLARQTISSFKGKISHEDMLIKLGMAKIIEGQFKIKAAAFILFGKEDNDLLLQRDFTFIKYNTEGKMYSFREDIGSPAVKLLDRMIELIRPFNRVTLGVTGLKRKEEEIYPEIALREALLNAFVHRDYRITGLKNECRFYPDRMEIISAGRLPAFITLKNITERHYSRNPKIMHAMLILGHTEELGQGVKLMIDTMKENGNPSPNFSEGPDYFKVTFFRKRTPIKSIEPLKILDEYFLQNDFLSRTKAEAILGLGKTMAKKVIKTLVNNGYLEKIGNGPSTTYRKRK